MGEQPNLGGSLLLLPAGYPVAHSLFHPPFGHGHRQDLFPSGFHNGQYYFSATDSDASSQSKHQLVLSMPTHWH